MSEIINNNGAFVSPEPENPATEQQIQFALWQLLRLLHRLTPPKITTKQMRVNNNWIQRKVWPLQGIRPTARKHTEEERRAYIVRMLQRAGITAEDFE